MKNVDVLLNELKMKFSKMGFGSQDPVINNVLGILSNETFNARTPEAMEVLTGKIETLINLDPETLMKRLNVRRGKIADREMQAYIEEKKEELKLDEDRRIDELQGDALESMGSTKTIKKDISEPEDELNKDDLFILVPNNGNFRLQDKEEIMKDKGNRQRNVFERNLKLLEALDAIREVSRKTDGMLQVDLNSMMNLPPNEFELQKKLLSRFKLQPLKAKGVELDRENPERQINLETITKEDLDNGDVIFAIPFERLQEMGEVYKKFREQMEEHLRIKKIDPDKEKSITIGEKLKTALSTEERQSENIPSTDNARRGREEDDEGR